MKAFIDTSSLVKKYFEEDGSPQFEILLDDISEITVSPIYWMEVNSAIGRRLQGGDLQERQARWIQKEAQKDLSHFSHILWNERLEQITVELLYKYQLKTLDSLQLASGLISKQDIFITSDKHLFSIAKKIFDQVRFV